MRMGDGPRYEQGLFTGREVVMANQVVIPFPGVRPPVARAPSFSSSEWRPRGVPSRGSRWLSRIATARDVVRAVVETLSYLGEARVRPPEPPALPPRRAAR